MKISRNMGETSMLAMIVLALIVLFFILLMIPILKASESSWRMRNLRRLVLKYDLHVVCVEYEPGNDLLFSNPNATLTIELIKTGNRYSVNFTVNVKGLGLSNKDFAENKSSTYKESVFRRCAIFEYDAATEKFYWQGKDVGVLLPLFQPLEDRIILFNAEFIPLGTLEPKISSYPPPSPVWASKTFTTLVYLKEGKVYIPELNRTWWISGLNVKPPIWSLYEEISRISGNDVLEIIHYGNNTIWSMPSVSIERNTGLIMSIRMPGPTRTSNNTRITVNDKPVSELPVALLPYLLGLRDDIHLYLRSIEAYD